MTPALSRFIDCARWMAATFVALHHAHGAFVNQADIMTASHAPPVYVWWFLTAYPFAHGAVVVFFVLSGFLVGGSAIERSGGGKPWVRNYLIDRTSRIYVVLLPTIVLVFALDTIGRRLFAGAGVYELPFYAGAFEPAWIAATLVSLQGIWFPTYGTNVALWSLGMEYWYYIVFALLMLPRSACYSAGARWGGLVLGLAIFCALALSPSYFMFGAFVWLLGALTRVAPRPLIRSKWLALVVWLAAVSAIRLVTRGAIVDDHPRKELLDAINALLFANILLTLRFDTGEGFSWCRARFHHALADFSYTLYATHMPILVFLWALIAAFAGDAWRMQLATPTHYAVATGALLFCMACAWLMSRFTEARTGAVRAWLRRVAPGARSAEKSATLSPS
ncbi:MAG: acyltransferase [Beijerinckiaceae bacterium]